MLGDNLMAVSSEPDLFEPNQVSTLVSVDDTLQFIEAHGFFYQENAEIGRLVDGLYKEGRIRSDDVKLDYFKPTLQQDSVSRT
jgi:hypothetical protein